MKLDLRRSTAAFAITVACLACSEDHGADVGRNSGTHDRDAGPDSAAPNGDDADAQQPSSQDDEANSGDAASETGAADGAADTAPRDNGASDDGASEGEASASTDDAMLGDETSSDESAPTADAISDASANGNDVATEDAALPPDDACTIAGQRVLRLPVLFRDFSEAHEDFGDLTCSGDVVSNVVAPALDAQGRPVAGTALSPACIGSAASFSEWYVDSPLNVRVPGEIVLFDDGAGGFVNRFGAKGEQFTATDPDTELGPSSYDPTCTDSCANYASYSAPCAAACEQLLLEVAAAEEAYSEATALADAGASDLAELQTQLQTASAELAVCNTECDVDKLALAEECSETCKPCSYSPELYCMYGSTLTFDGNPLFFPVDDIMGFTLDRGEAKLPDAFGYPGWPWERVVFGQPVLHNFYFTTELEVSFLYTAGLEASVEFLGDDDAWVFINGHLAIDLGGLHTATSGLATIDASTAASYGLVEGQTHAISIFHAERQKEGSSFKLALRGFTELGDSACGQ